jgi:hypothetical protein
MRRGHGGAAVRTRRGRWALGSWSSGTSIVTVKILDVAEFYSERGGGVRAYLTQLSRE